jgi:hypothetical protein
MAYWGGAAAGGESNAHGGLADRIEREAWVCMSSLSKSTQVRLAMEAVDAHMTGNEKVERFYTDRFEAELRPAWEARYIRNGAGHKHFDHFPNSVDTLSPKNNFVRTLNTIPITPGIPCRTIAGDRGRDDSPNSSDGLVPYWSSHLPDAKSEKIVPTHHNAQQSTQAIEEVHRILALHARADGD